MRPRATIVVLRDKKVLLVRDKGKPKYSLPGGGIERNETTITAATRELYEELHLPVRSITRRRDADFKGSLSFHKVCLASIDNEPHLIGNELEKFIWWDMKTEIPVYTHVKYILHELKLLV
jgi:8-oxo-dGTP pyrophosphatase MutT (NUDIX family)